MLLSDHAASKVKSLLEQEGRDDLALRIAVQPGGCSGLRYQLFFDERSLDGDVTHDFDGVNVVAFSVAEELPYQQVGAGPALVERLIDAVKTARGVESVTVDQATPFSARGARLQFLIAIRAALICCGQKAARSIRIRE